MTGIASLPHIGPINPLLIVAIIILFGSAGGWAARRLHVPAVTGNILAGVLLGLTLFQGQDAARSLQALSTFAMGLIAVDAGGQLSYRRVHNALFRIVSIGLCESVGALLLVGLAMWALSVRWDVALAVAALAVGGAPATTLAIIRGARARGPFVKTLLAVVSLDSSLCIILFAFARSVIAQYHSSAAGNFDVALAFAHALFQLAGASVIGLGLGFFTQWVVLDPRFHNFSTVFVSILVGTGLSLYLGLSPLLTCLLYGIYLGNSTREAEEQLSILSPIEPLLYVSFFTLAGVAVHLEALSNAGVLLVVYLLARIMGKAAGAFVGGFVAKASPRILYNMPSAFVPQAGVVIGLVVLFEGDHRIPTEVGTLVGTLVLAAVTVNEIIGPIFTRMALARAKEIGLDRPRLVEFLQEEFIMTNLQARDKWDAIEKLCDFFARTHNIRPPRREELLRSVLGREKTMSTAIGHGAALPHGMIESGSAISGVLAICPDGVDFDAPDGQPVRLLVLIVTPRDHEARHLEVLASVAAMMSDERRRARLVTAADPGEAWEIIEDTEERDFNYFLEDEEAAGRG